MVGFVHRYGPRVGLLPAFPDVPRSGRGAFRLVLLCWLLARTAEAGRAGVSQRDLQLVFNRTDRGALAGNLKGLERDGWLRVERPHRDDQPDRYFRGPNFRSSPAAGRRMAELSAMLFGPSGVLGGWVPAEAWGRGCVGAEGLLVVGVLRSVGAPVGLSPLEDCLKLFMGPRTVRKYVESLAGTPELLLIDGGVVSLRAGWTEVLGEWVLSSRECSPKLGRVAAEVNREREHFRLRLSAGHLSDAERAETLAHPCVFCGRRLSSNRMTLEHWPPAVFLREFVGQDSMHFMFPMCRRDNEALGKFIQHQVKPFGVHPDPDSIHIFAPADALRVFRGLSGVTQDRYFDAYRRFLASSGDDDRRRAVAAAGDAVSTVLAAWLKCVELGVLHNTRFITPASRRRLRGPNARPSKFRPGAAPAVEA